MKNFNPVFGQDAMKTSSTTTKEREEKKEKKKKSVMPKTAILSAFASPCAVPFPVYIPDFIQPPSAPSSRGGSQRGTMSLVQARGCLFEIQRSLGKREDKQNESPDDDIHK